MILNIFAGNLDWPNAPTNRNWYAAWRREDVSVALARGETLLETGFKFYIWDGEKIFSNVTDNRSTTAFPDSPGFLYDRLQANSEFRLMFGDSLQRHFFNNGALTSENVADRFQGILDQIDRAIVGESARWGDAFRSVPYTRDAEWVAETARLMNSYFPFRNQIVLDQFSNLGLLSELAVPRLLVGGTVQYGGTVDAGDLLSFRTDNAVLIETPLLEQGDAVRAFVAVDGDFPTATWTTLGFDPDNPAEGRTAWTDGATGTGVGYERGAGYETLIQTDVEAPMFNVSRTALIRQTFPHDDSVAFDQLSLRMRYDDAFVAYLNGVEVARNNNVNVVSPPSDATLFDPNLNHEADQFEVFDISAFENLLVDGDNVLAILGINRTIDSSDFLVISELIGAVIDVTALPVPIWFTTDGTDPRDPMTGASRRQPRCSTVPDRRICLIRPWPFAHEYSATAYGARWLTRCLSWKHRCGSRN